jgi:hypothetical protein
MKTLALITLSTFIAISTTGMNTNDRPEKEILRFIQSLKNDVSNDEIIRNFFDKRSEYFSNDSVRKSFDYFLHTMRSNFKKADKIRLLKYADSKQQLLSHLKLNNDLSFYLADLKSSSEIEINDDFIYAIVGTLDDEPFSSLTFLLTDKDGKIITFMYLWKGNSIGFIDVH